MAIRFVTVNDALDLPAAIVARLKAVGLKGDKGDKGNDGDQGPAGVSNVFVVQKLNGAWPNRPNALKETVGFWIGPEPGPSVVTTGTGGMYESDMRFVTNQ